MGLHMFHFRKGKTAEATIIGVIGLFLAVVLGGRIAESHLAGSFTFSEPAIVYMMAIYGFLASVLPVWVLLCPRDYLSSFMKIGTVAFLVIGVLFVAPRLQMPATTPFVAGGGPIIQGKLYPFVFITIACGAISGFHSLISSGTTPKMLAREGHARMIGYGSMLMEGLVGVVALIAATSLIPGDYFSINIDQHDDQARSAYTQFVDTHSQEGFDLHEQKLQQLTEETGEKNLRGRTGGAVTLAVGIAQIFSGLPGLKGLMKYWYHFAIMFEALFILSTIDAGTRVARFLVGEFVGRFHAPFERPDWMPGAIITSALVVIGWAYFILTGSISTIWPMFGIANQLLAAIALCVGTSVIINEGRARYAWVTLIPLSFVAVTTLTAGWESIFNIFLKDARSTDHALRGYLDIILTAIMMTCVLIVLVDSILRWRKAITRTPAPPAIAGIGD
jgi:carbon starvation protein